MSTMQRTFVPVVLALAGLGASGLVSAQQAPGYTAEQVTRGRTVYQGAGGCAACHGPDLGGGQFGPPLRGVNFRNRWAGATLAELFEQTRNMPPGGTGSLGDSTYADLVALMLAENGFAAGDRPVPTDRAALAGLSLPGERPAQARNIPGGGLDPGAKLPFWPTPPNPLDRLRPVTEALLGSPPEGSWLQWRRTWDAHGFSPLAQITKDNVKDLQLAWSLALPGGANTATPLVHDGVMFAYSQDVVVAVDAKNGEVLWRYSHPLPDGVRPGIKRTLALYGNKVFVPTSDARMVALDMQTGRVVWNEAINDGEPRVSTTSGPLAAKNRVMIGVNGRIEGGGFIQAFDTETGAKVWRFYSIARPGEPGGNTWNDLPLEARNGGTVWTPGYYDPVNDLAFFGPAPTYDTGPLRDPVGRPGVTNDALYTNATVALDPDDGRLVWHYQHMQNDQWDLDWSFERQIVDLDVDGRSRRLLVTGGKLGIFDVLDPVDGRYVSSFEMGIQNLVTGIDPRTGRKIHDPAKVPRPDVRIDMCPHAGGGRSWMPTAYNPAAKVLFIPAVETCMSWLPVGEGERPFLTTGVRTVLQPPPDSDGRFGRVQAINVETGRTVWTQRERAPVSSGVLATAGGVVFAGAIDRRLKAYDDATGNILWQARLADVPSAVPITYAVDGRQYVAMVVGYGGPQSASFTQLTPEITLPVAASSSIWVFALPE